MSMEQPPGAELFGDEQTLGLWERYQRRVDAVRNATEAYYGSQSLGETMTAIQQRDLLQDELDRFVETFGIPDRPPDLPPRP